MPLEQRVLATASLRVCHVGAALPGGDQFHAHRGRVLKIGIHDDHGIGIGPVQAGTHGHLMAVVASERVDGHSGVERSGLLQKRERAVPAAVVDEDELERIPLGKGIGGLPNLIEEGLDVPLFIEDGEDVGDAPPHGRIIAGRRLRRLPTRVSLHASFQEGVRQPALLGEHPRLAVADADISIGDDVGSPRPNGGVKPRHLLGLLLDERHAPLTAADSECRRDLGSAWKSPCSNTRM